MDDEMAQKLAKWAADQMVDESDEEMDEFPDDELDESEVVRPPTRLNGLPEFPFPFRETGSHTHRDSISAPLTRKERLICHVMQSVMRKPGWMRKYHSVVGKWREELRQAQIPRDLDPDADAASDGAGDSVVQPPPEGSEGQQENIHEGSNAEENNETDEAEARNISEQEAQSPKTTECKDAGSLAVATADAAHYSEAQAQAEEKAGAEEAQAEEAEAKEKADDSTEKETSHKIPEDVIEYALAELKWLVDTHDGGPVELSPVTGVFVIPDADKLLEPSGCKEVLVRAVAQMEAVPEDQVDYHPDSNNQVVDLVHPSLFPLSYGKTRVMSGLDDEAVMSWDRLIGSVGNAVAQLPQEFLETDSFYETWHSEFISEKFHWLPAELDVPAAEDEAARFRSYINNLNPREYPELYPALAEIFNRCFVPLFNRVLTQLAYPPHHRLPVDPHSWYEDWKGEREYDMEDDEDAEKWYEDRQPMQPAVPEFQPPPVVPKEEPIDLRGTGVQVIVKIAEIKLTPADPVYRGGTWHVEGMKNESIVATGIYYFASDNIKESELMFRKAVGEPDCEQSDNLGMWKVYGLRNDSPLIQRLGSVQTNSPGLCLAFPNLYHHKVSPFSLADSSKPGFRKILAFFLIDPGKRIPSTARVPPQQARWRQLEMERSLHPCSVLPAPALHRIIQDLCRAADAMDEGEAKRLRMHLMMERKMLLDEARGEILERPCNLCEH